MALFKIEKGLSKDLATKRPNTQEGWCYFTTDDGKLYIDTDTATANISGRVPLNAYKADALKSPNNGTLAYLDWTGTQTETEYFATWDASTYGSSKPTVRAMSAANMRANLNVLTATEIADTYLPKTGGSISGGLSVGGAFAVLGEVAFLNTLKVGAGKVLIGKEDTNVYFSNTTAGSKLQLLNDGGLTFNDSVILRADNYANYAMPTAHWAWSGQEGQPTWVWGGNEYQQYKVWNPANFSVNHANSATVLTEASIGQLNWYGDHMLSSAARPAAKLHFGSETLYQHRNDTYYILLDSGNYNSYAPTLTGTGASGTWGINVTGSAATLSSTLAINKGGTGATDKKTAWSNLIPFYTKPWETTAEDTGTNWASLGNNSITWWPSDATGIYNKPSDWGLVFTISASESGSSEMHQLYFAQANGAIYHRGGNGQTTSSMEGNAWAKLWQTGDSVTGAVWNDYAEYRESNCQEFGYVLIENGDDTLSKSTERLQQFAGISSDTWGFSQGETEKAKTPIAVAGRVLVYPYQDRNNYKPGDAVCAAPGGTVDIMTEEEIIRYPHRIVGTVSCVPNYEEWGGGDREPVKVNGRIWIKVV